MTSKDKTGDQLVASIRKSKSGPATRKAPPRRSSGGKSTATAAIRAADEPVMRAATKPRETSGYSLGRRVWPD